MITSNQQQQVNRFSSSIFHGLGPHTIKGSRLNDNNPKILNMVGLTMCVLLSFSMGPNQRPIGLHLVLGVIYLSKVGQMGLDPLMY